MVKLQWKITLLLSLVFLIGGCKGNNNLSLDEPEGTISISTVGLDETVAATRLSTADLSLRIENTRAEVLRKWGNLADVPSHIRVVAGSYRLVAWSGDTSLLPSFLDMYYEGEAKFAVTAGENIAVPIVARVGVTKVKVEFNNTSFEDQYSAYSADIRTTTAANADARFLNFTATTTDEGNFLPGTLRIRMRLVSKTDGKEYLFYPSPISGLKAAERRTITLKVVTVSGKNSLVVTTDDGYEKEEDITLELPSSALPKPAPIVRASSFTVGERIDGNEGYIPTTKYAATIVAQGGIKSVKIRTSSPIVTAMWGGRNEIEMVGADKEVQNLLTSTGFVWDEALNSVETAAVKYGRTEISFARLFGALIAQKGSEYTDYPFEIDVLDMLNQSNKNLATGDGRFYFTTRVLKPDFGWSVAPTAGNVWSSHAEFDIKYMSNTSKTPKIWVKEADGQWICPDTQNFKGVDGEPTMGVQSVTGLKPTTQYAFRLAMGDHVSEEFAATTEPLAIVVNGDMETWQSEQLGTSPHKIPYYQPYAKGGSQYWATNNDRTTSYRASVVTYGYNSFPAVSYTFKAHDGNLAAELRNTSASNINPLNTTSITQEHSQVPGMLYIGTFGYVDKTDVVHYGKPFGARPAKMTFYYTYTPYNGDSFDAVVVLYNGGKEIGRGQFVSGASVGDYQAVDVSITYSDRRSRADQMAIIFRSSVNSPAPVRKVNDGVDVDMIGNIDYNKGWSVFIGSILHVDDISLGY